MSNPCKECIVRPICIKTYECEELVAYLRKALEYYCPITRVTNSLIKGIIDHFSRSNIGCSVYVVEDRYYDRVRLFYCICHISNGCIVVEQGNYFAKYPVQMRY